MLKTQRPNLQNNQADAAQPIAKPAYQDNQWFFVRPTIDATLGIMIGLWIGNLCGLVNF